MQLQEILIDQTLRELTPRGTPSFPLEMYYNDISEFITHYVPWHWHKEVEFGYLLKGRMLIEYNGKKKELSPGDGFFINSNCLHAMRPLDVGLCETVNIVFDPEIIAGAPHSVYANKYVLPLTANHEIDIVPLTPAIAWQNFVLAALKECFYTYGDADYGYEIKIRSSLSQIWFLLLEKLNCPAPAQCKAENTRMKNMLTYIHKNYKSALSLEDISQSSGIGNRTCCRYFREQIGMSPFEYLLEYRVKMAAELLVATNQTITDICFDTGFNDTSYFSKTFRKLTGYTPTQFRKTRQI